MIQSNVDMHEMALTCGWLAQMAKDFSQGTDENEGAKEDRAKMSASFVETARYIVAMLAGHLGGVNEAMAFIQQVMNEYAAQNAEVEEEDEG